MRFPRRTPSLVLLLLAVAIPALFLGARSASSTSRASRMATFSEILSLVEERHVPGTEAKKVIYAGIHGMLGTLDPHTNFLGDEAYREMREEQRGSFYGLGIVISKRGRNQPLRVVSPIADTPAARLGIRAGDVITHIRDRRSGVDIDTLGLTIQESVKHLRGPRGTEVEITIDRPGLDEPLDFQVVRDAVRTPAVDQAFMIEDGIGYVHIANFTETTTTELDLALERLRRQGAKKLVLDLQRNPGGLLDQAISVTSRFLGPDELVVYTEGRGAEGRRDFNTLRDVPRIDWPVVVVLDRGSASASEIVAGAIQDHDRGIVVGETSFGKGLVQSVFPLSESTGLALTTQKYYTPVGRSIQRPYRSQEEYYYENLFREGTSAERDPDAPVYLTETGRKVYGGGGIAPDVSSSEEIPKVLNGLLRVSAFTRFLSPTSDAARSEYLKKDDKLFADFLDFLRKDEDFDDIAGVTEAESTVRLYLRAELALSIEGMAARGRVLAQSSEVIKSAVNAFPQAEALLQEQQRVRRARAAGRSQHSR